MKKLAIAQIVLGILVVGSLIYWTGWVSPGYHSSVGVDDDGNIILHMLGLIKPNPLVPSWSMIYLGLGLCVFGCGIAQLVKARRQEKVRQGKLENSRANRGGTGNKLAIAQIVLGVLIVVSLVWFIGWVEWEYHSLTIIREGIEIEVQPLPGWMVRMVTWKVISFLLGLAIIGGGVVQFSRVRKLA